MKYYDLSNFLCGWDVSGVLTGTGDFCVIPSVHSGKQLCLQHILRSDILFYYFVRFQAPAWSIRGENPCLSRKVVQRTLAPITSSNSKTFILQMTLRKSQNLLQGPWLFHFSPTGSLVRRWELKRSTPLWPECIAVDQLSNAPCGLQGPSTYWDGDSSGLLTSVRDAGPTHNEQPASKKRERCFFLIPEVTLLQSQFSILIILYSPSDHNSKLDYEYTEKCPEEEWETESII